MKFCRPVRFGLVLFSYVQICRAWEVAHGEGVACRLGVPTAYGTKIIDLFKLKTATTKSTISAGTTFSSFIAGQFNGVSFGVWAGFASHRRHNFEYRYCFCFATRLSVETLCCNRFEVCALLSAGCSAPERGGSFASYFSSF